MKSIKNAPHYVFILLLLAMAHYYGYDQMFFKRPQSTHKWRQSDCASIALNYYQGGMHFFTPETHNLTSDMGTSGKSCPSEIPILYYTVALFYSIFGYREYIYRMFNTLLFLSGIYFLFRIYYYVLKDIFWAIALSLLFFTAPVLVFYGNNFLSNSGALAFSVFFWYFFIRFFFESRPQWFYLSMLFILIAAALKITALFSFFAVTGVFLLERVGAIHFTNGTTLFNKPRQQVMIMVAIVLIPVFWIAYARYFNHIHHSTYFSTTVFPIWKLSNSEIQNVLQNVRKIWLAQYFQSSAFWFLGFCLFFILIFFKKLGKFWQTSLPILFLEGIIYVLLQFWTFADHDYYVIGLYILPILLVLAAFDLLKQSFHALFYSPILKLVFSMILLFNTHYAFKMMKLRYESWMNDFKQNEAIYTITPYLRQIGISPNDTIISIPDWSNASLYLMNQKGWTEYTDEQLNRGIPVHYNQDAKGIRLSIQKGARYLIVNGLSQLYKKPYLQAFCKHLTGAYKGVYIFDLSKQHVNFHLPKREVEATYFCDAETINKDSNSFVDTVSRIVFGHGKTQTAQMAHSGKFSSALFKSQPYGMTLTLNNLSAGESIDIEVWRKGKEDQSGSLVASCMARHYYRNDYTIIKKDTTQWELLRMQLFIPTDLIHQEMVIYPYNYSTDTVFFDDLKIIRYKDHSP